MIFFIFFLLILFLLIFFYLFRINKNNINKNNNSNNINNINVHLVVYSNGEPYNSTKEKTIRSAQKYCSKNIIIHEYNLDIIKNKSWFKEIEQLPKYNKIGRRDGYYNCWKAYIIKEVLDKIEDGDILYYVDSSRYYLEGFTEKFDLLCNITKNLGIIAGSVGLDMLNIHYCNNLKVWNKVYSNNKINNFIYLFKKHVLNSWFILEKNELNKKFIDEWVYWSCYKDNELKDPLVTYQDSVDQSVFNILTYKYNFYIFYDIFTLHNNNKNKNLVNKIINNSNNPYKYFIKLR